VVIRSSSSEFRSSPERVLDDIAWCVTPLSLVEYDVKMSVLSDPSCALPAHASDKPTLGSDNASFVHTDIMKQI